MVSAGGLHALAYCERLFYLENVERIRLADERVFAGRRAHEEKLPDEEGTWAKLRFESTALGLCGEVDLLRKIDGALVPYELKRGRSAGRKGASEAWQTDRLQVGAYALLAEEQFGQLVHEARVHYLATRATVRVAVDDALRGEVHRALARARELMDTAYRPPVSRDPARCARCSLAPACLPEEARLAADPKWRPIRLLPPHPQGSPVHVLQSDARVGRSGNSLTVSRPNEPVSNMPVVEVGAIVLHGNAQISTQAIRLCTEREIPVHWVTTGGSPIASLGGAPGGPSRHLRQFTALQDPITSLGLARALVQAKVSSQLRFLLRATRGARPQQTEQQIRDVRAMLRRAASAKGFDELRGLEGAAARAYFASFPDLIATGVGEQLYPSTRTRHPATDRFSAILNYGYGMLYQQVFAAVLAVGLHPGVGFFHRNRTAAQTLVLDLMELFRVPVVDMAVIGAVNRRMFEADLDFDVIQGRISLSLSGRKKLISVIERRLSETWHHSVVGYSLSYARIIELEARLLEKEWSGEGGLFAKLRIR